jgi:hypothetical protein
MVKALSVKSSKEPKAGFARERSPQQQCDRPRRRLG